MLITIEGREQLKEAEKAKKAIGYRKGWQLKKVKNTIFINYICIFKNLCLTIIIELTFKTLQIFKILKID